MDKQLERIFENPVLILHELMVERFPDEEFDDESFVRAADYLNQDIEEDG